MSRSVLAGVLACASLLGAASAEAHVVVGARVFPVTLTFDDPGVGDEATLPQFQFVPGESGQRDYQFLWEYDKTITPTTALIYNQGYDILTQPGLKAQTGIENAFVTGKWQAFTFPSTESVVSLGVIREFSGGPATQDIGGDAFGATSPTIYGGQGMGFLPVPMLRPLAVTGELNYNISDRRLNNDGDNSGSPNSVTAALSVQYSLPYLQSQVKDVGLGSFFGRMIPLVELTWYTPVEAPANGFPSTFNIAPGVIWLGNDYQVGVEALIPGNRAAGPHAGLIVQVHFFFDDLFPHTLGKPIFN